MKSWEQNPPHDIALATQYIIQNPSSGTAKPGRSPQGDVKVQRRNWSLEQPRVSALLKVAHPQRTAYAECTIDFSGK